MRSFTFTTTLQRDGDSNWHYAHVPAEVRAALRHMERRGFIPVTATVGGTAWAASLMPWADGSAQIMIKKVVRESEGIQAGQEFVIRVVPRVE